MTLLQNIRYALFDFDGVIADTEPLYLELDRRACMHFGYEPTAEELRGFVGHPSEIAAPELLAGHGIHITGADFRSVWDPSRDVYGSADLAPSEGLHELWERLDAAGIVIGVVSTSLASDLVQALNQFGLMRYVSVLVGREHITQRKPAPEPYLRALAWLVGCELGGAATKAARDTETVADAAAGEAPAKAAPGNAALREAAARAIAVEDSPTGIAAARAAGLYCFGYTGGSVAQDTSAASETIDDLLEVAERLGI